MVDFLFHYMLAGEQNTFHQTSWNLLQHSESGALTWLSFYLNICYCFTSKRGKSNMALSGRRLVQEATKA